MWQSVSTSMLQWNVRTRPKGLTFGTLELSRSTSGTSFSVLCGLFDVVGCVGCVTSAGLTFGLYRSKPCFFINFRRITKLDLTNWNCLWSFWASLVDQLRFGLSVIAQWLSTNLAFCSKGCPRKSPIVTGGSKES